MRCLILCLLFLSIHAGAQPNRTLIVVFDGLRPDYITEQNMPNLFALRNAGSYVSKNHSVFPTVTRVNASSYATGSYPGTHGLLGNTVYFPNVDRNKGLDTGDAEELQRIADATDGNLLTTLSLGEILSNAGLDIMVFSSGSSGQALLQNHKVKGRGVVHPEVILPESLAQDVHKAIGLPPPSAKPNTNRHEWAMRALAHYGLKADGPQVSAIWFSDPDGAAHTYGIGSPEAMESIRIVDEKFGAIVSTLRERGLLDRFNIIVTADHGFATQVGTVGVRDFLMNSGFKSDDVILAGNAIYVKDHDPKLIQNIVSVLQEQPWAGAIFTKATPKDPNLGWIEGTLSFESIHWQHDRSADILFDYHWDDEPNKFGYAGRSHAKGVAGHGGASSHEITIPLIAAGPDFKSSYASPLPASNTDIAPTILHLCGLDMPRSMDGRVLTELLRKDSNRPAKAKTETIRSTMKKSDKGGYSAVLQITTVGRQRYVDFARVVREK